MNIPLLFNAVTEATIFGSVVGITIFILKSTLLRNLAARWQYTLWSVMIFKLIFPKGPESKLSIFNKINVAETLSETDLMAIAQKAEIAENTVHINSTINIVPYIWLAGFIISILWTVANFILLKHKIYSSSAMPCDDTLKILEDCKKITHITKNIRVVVQSHISSTALFGILHPQILITDDFEKNDASNIKHTLIHELSHYKRGDIAINYILLFLRCVHWFNPVIWFLFRKIRRDTELATDELTMIYLKPDEHKKYGMTLINTASACSAKSPKLLGMANNKKDIKKRIKAISKFKKPGIFQHLSGILTIIMIASVCLTSAVAAKPVALKILETIPDVPAIEIKQENTTELQPKNSISKDETNKNNTQLKQSADVKNYIETENFTEKSISDSIEKKESGKKIENVAEKVMSEKSTAENVDNYEKNSTTDTNEKNKTIEPKTNDTPSYNKVDASVTTPKRDFDELENFENRNIDSIISTTGQVIDSTNKTTSLADKAKIISYNTNYNGTYTFNVIPNSDGYIQFMVENEGFDHDVYIGIYHVDSKGHGWDYCFNTKTKTPIYLDGYEHDEEYVVTINCYCPGYYDINGRILVY